MYLRANADLVASAGRNGDTTLVHMTPDEVESLNTLALASGIGALPINPYTGYPEASFLGKLLKGIGSIAATVGGTALLGPLGGGLASALFTGITEKNLKKGLQAGLLSYMGGKALTGVAKAGAGAKDVAAATGDGAATLSDAGREALMQSASPGEGMDFLRNLRGAASSGWGTGRQALEMGGREMMSGRTPFVAMPMLGEVNNAIATEEWERKNLRDQADYDRAVREARRDYYRRFGRNPYGNMYANRYRGGGLVDVPPMSQEQMLNGGIMSMARRGYKEGGFVENLSGKLTEMMREKHGWPDVEDIAPYETLLPAAPQPGYMPGFHGEQMWMLPAGGQQSPLTGGEFGSNPFDTGMTQGIIQQGMPQFLYELMYGSHPGAGSAMPRSGEGGGVNYPFDGARRSYAAGGMVNPNGGMGDGITAALMNGGSMVDTVEVSPGEFVVPADVVSMIGDGDSRAGGQELENMMARVRLHKTGTTEQAPPFDPQLLGV